ncbi:MAG: gamma-butyrobetaine hydroxylase-like domain-containing protein [Pseudomonadales bacterium]
MQRPTRINYRKGSRILQVDFAQQSYELPAELLRVFSPSAEVRGHGAGERKLQSGKKYVQITGIDPVGNYAIRLVFDDGHDSGIYAFDYLAELGSQQQAFWDEYLAELEAANASRLPVIAVGQWTPRE